MKICESCNQEHDSSYGSGRFCSCKCARNFSTKSKRKEINQKVSIKMQGKQLSNETKIKIGQSKTNQKHSDETKIKISVNTKGKKKGPMSDEHKEKISRSFKETMKEKCPDSILQLSTRTVTKILIRGNFGCSRCGWNESTCDIHHINGRKIENANNHVNLSLLCPNCHRLVHTSKIKKEELISLTEQIGDKWKEFYYWS